jgi:exodeoxyribonuclease VII small subunit
MRQKEHWSSQMSEKNPSDIKFEAALESLEEVVEQLESGALSLEEALAAFEKGVGLVRYCNQKLTEVEKRIELLVRDKEGKIQLKAFEPIVSEQEHDG